MSTAMPAHPTSLALTTPATSPTSAAPAVEVVTQLGTSVVSVDNLGVGAETRGRGGRFVSIGAALLAGAVLAFGAGVMNAKDEASARERWAKDGKPMWAYRPSKGSATADFAALGGGVLGLGLVATGLLRRREQARTTLRVGEAAGVDVPLAGAHDVTLVAPDGAGGFRANLIGFSGEVRRGQNVASIESLTAAGHTSIALAVGTHVKASLGKTTFHVRGMEKPARTAAPSPLVADRQVLTFVAASAIVHLGVLAFLNAVPPDQNTAQTDMNANENTSVMAHLNSNEDPNPEETKPDDSDDVGENGGMASTIVSMALEDGTLGHDQPNPNPAKLRVKDRGLNEELARKAALEAASSAGVLAAMTSPISVYQGGDISDGLDDLDITGGIIDGDGTGAPMGSFGWGVKGQGLGCGTPDGKNCSGQHVGPYATIGWEGRDYAGPFSQRPGRPGRPGDRVAKVPTVKLSPPIACTQDAPCLDKEIIRRYVKRNIEKITYCYEKELLAQPGLEGTVMVNFTLNGNGRVIDSKASGVDPTVSSCIAEVVSSIHFPKVGDDGIYPIKYPFQLRPSGR
ncbi:MAG TPA: AgmX/PglI C-terminal domain-containing protein [Kofleriaceae bacterium]|nr:AgmX/PglI C-terminal domain-containing protein [Kofleriaceae bacterium]